MSLHDRLVALLMELPVDDLSDAENVAKKIHELVGRASFEAVLGAKLGEAFVSRLAGEVPSGWGVPLYRLGIDGEAIFRLNRDGRVPTCVGSITEPGLAPRVVELLNEAGE